MPSAVSDYFEGGDLVGSTVSQHQYKWPHRAFFCPYCGDLWAREIHEQDECDTHGNLHWQIIAVSCRDCGDGQLLEGANLNNCNRALLEREVQILCGIVEERLTLYGSQKIEGGKK